LQSLLSINFDLQLLDVSFPQAGHVSSLITFIQFRLFIEEYLTI